MILLLFLVLIVSAISVGVFISVSRLIVMDINKDNPSISRINIDESVTNLGADIISIREPRKALLIGFGDFSPGSSFTFRVYIIDQYGDSMRDVDITWSLYGYVDGDKIYFYPWDGTMGIMLLIGENEKERELILRATSTANPLVYDIALLQISPNPYAHRVQVGEQVGILREGEQGTATIPVITQNISDGNQYAIMILPLGITVYSWDLIEQSEDRVSTDGDIEIVNGMGNLTFLYDGTTEAGTWDVFLGVGRANILFTLTIEPANY